MLVYINVGHDLNTWSSKYIYINSKYFFAWSEEPARCPLSILLSIQYSDVNVFYIPT